MIKKNAILLVLNFLLVLYISAIFVIYILPTAQIEGVVTWQYDRIYPDTGSELYVFQGDKLVALARCDDQGRFRIGRLIPAGYTVFMVSANAGQNVSQQDEKAARLREKLTPYRTEGAAFADSPGVRTIVEELQVYLRPMSTKVLDHRFTAPPSN